MVARDCKFCHEDMCVAKIELGENYECKGMNKTNYPIIECNLDNSELIEECYMCDSRPAKEDGLCVKCKEKY